MTEERQMILRMLKEGKISVEEADALLQALQEERAAEAAAGEEVAAARPDTSGTREAPIGSGGPKIQIDVGKIMQEIADTIPREVLKGLRIGTRGRPRSRWVEIVEGLWGMVERSVEVKGETSMAPGETLEVHNAWGDVTMRPSPDGQMRFSAQIRAWGHLPEDADQILSAVTVRPQRTGSTVLLEVPRPEARRLRVDFQIELPRGVNTRIHEAKGDLQVGGLQGTLAISLASGDVQISDHAGRVDLDVKSGDLTVTQVNGDVFMDFKHGDVDLADVRGRVHGRVISGDVQVTHAQGASLDVINGDVDVRDVVGDIEIDTKSGDVDLRAIRPGRLKVRAISGDVSAAVAVLGQGDVTIETISGDIGLGLPPDARASIEASVRSGEIDCALPLEGRRADRRTLSGALSGGGTGVRLTAVSGDIDIGAYRE